MTYVVNDKCIMCKHTTCVSVCPVDCFYEGPNMLVINPDECIDCGVCEPECPEEAITTDADSIVHWTNINKEYSEKWYNNQIVDEKAPMIGYEEASKIPDKTDLFDGSDYEQ